MPRNIVVMTDHTSHRPIRPVSGVLSARLDTEWNRLHRCPSAIGTVRAWSERGWSERGWSASNAPDPNVEQLFSNLVDLDELIEATQRGRSTPDADAVLAALVVLARSDELAGRVLVQRLLPGLVPAAARHRWHTGVDDPIELAVGALWIAIHAHDPQRRPRHIAPALLFDAMHIAFRKPMRRRSSGEHVTAPDRFDDAASETATPAFVELADIVGEARRAGVPTYDLDLLRHLVRTQSPESVAQERGVSSRTVRNHRDRAVQRIRDAVFAAD